MDFTHPFLHIGLGVLGYKGAAPRSLQELADDDSMKVILFLIIFSRLEADVLEKSDCQVYIDYYLIHYHQRLEPFAVAPLLQASISLATLSSKGSGQRYR